MGIPGNWQRAARGAMLFGADGTLAPSIFAEMSALAVATGAINLGQGFPDEDGPPEVLEAARQAIADGVNQYPPGRGMPVLRDAIAAHQARWYGIRVDPEREVLVTAGATEALTATILALTEPGDELVVFEPFYDLYGAVAELAGVRLVTVPLVAPDFGSGRGFEPDLEALGAAISERTRLILVNSPHNPTGAVLSREALELIVALAGRFDAIIVADEVYEHLTFGIAAVPVEHTPIASLPGAAERTVTISSGGKTFSTTGWKIGWAIAPAPIIDAILSVKQFLTYVNGAPFQPAIAAGLALPDSFFVDAAATLQAKRDLLMAGLTAAGFTTTTPSAGYFIVADAAALGVTDAATFSRQLPALAGVVAVPVTAFVREEHRATYASLLRFAFCKRVEVLEEAVARLATRVRPGIAGALAPD